MVDSRWTGYRGACRVRSHALLAAWSETVLERFELGKRGRETGGGARPRLQCVLRRLQPVA